MAPVIMMPTVSAKNAFTTATRLPKTRPMSNDRAVKVFSVIIKRNLEGNINISVCGELYTSLVDQGF
jgi:hypothetical protein